MAHGVFVHRADSIYEDSPSSQYQFPRQYKTRVDALVGDWIIYYEPTKVSDTRGYFAVAKVQDVIVDRSSPEMYLARVEPGSYLQFANPVPFRLADEVAESGVLNDSGRISGRAQSVVRPLGREDFHRIVELGTTEREWSPEDPGADISGRLHGFEEEQMRFEVERDRVAVLSSRPLRDRNFRRVILRAYESRCGITGLQISNGTGAAEVEAAHIRPVDTRGPDIVNNGIALSKTVHWMFDRGLLTFTDDLDIEISRHVNDRERIEMLVNPTGRLIGPVLQRDRPHPAFLDWHRTHRFKI